MRSLAILLFSVVFAPATALAAPDYIPNDSIMQRLSPSEARRLLTSLPAFSFACVNCSQYQFAKGMHVGETEVELIRSQGGPIKLPLATLKLEVEKWHFGKTTALSLDNTWVIWLSGPWNGVPHFEYGKQIADALYVLKRHGAGFEDPEIERTFQNALRAYQADPTKLEFPESARRHRIVAEAAVRDKQFDKAAEQYGEALRIAPWWPEGRFNRAQILGELGQFAQAAREMQRFLLLAPQHANARAAQDKVYEWEAKASRR